MFPGGKLGLFSVGVVNAETLSVVNCTVVVGGSCVAVTVDITGVALLGAVLAVLETRPGLFVVVTSLAVVTD